MTTASRQEAVFGRHRPLVRVLDYLTEGRIETLLYLI